MDNQTVFTNAEYIRRYSSGQIAQIPKIVGTTAREAAPLVPYPINNYTAGPSEQRVYTQTLSTVCAAHNTSVLRNQANLTTWRYQWGGNFSDLTGNVPWLGAYHYSDLYMLFGTYLITPGPSTDLERQASEKMQDLFLAFVSDPTDATLSAQGWPAYDATSSGDGGNSIALFAADNEVIQLRDGVDIEGACWNSSIVYDTTP